MRKKNSNSSVPSGMHSLAQRSQQERRQKMEQQRARTVPQEPMRVPPQQPAHFGRQPMQQVPPPPVQKPEKALSQEALQELQQQDCPGFSPDSLFIDCASQRQPNRNASVKVHKFFPRKQQIYTQKFPVLENF